VDTRLSREGQAQAEAVARALAERSFAAIYATPLTRAQATARAVADSRRLPVLIAPAFREICLGIWEGLSIPEVRARFPGVYAEWLDQPHAAVIPEAERLAEVRERVLRGLGELRAAHEGQTVCLVAHGVTIRLLVLDALGLPPERLWSVGVKPTAISEIEYHDGASAVLHRVNVVSHLDGLDGKGRA
jgi:broad specificity phosphatase PhoE